MIIHRVDLPTGKKYTHYIFHFDPEVFFKCIRSQKSPMCWKMVKAIFGCSYNKLAAVRQTLHGTSWANPQGSGPAISFEKELYTAFSKGKKFFQFISAEK